MALEPSVGNLRSWSETGETNERGGRAVLIYERDFRRRMDRGLWRSGIHHQDLVSDMSRLEGLDFLYWVVSDSSV